MQQIKSVCFKSISHVGKNHNNAGFSSISPLLQGLFGLQVRYNHPTLYSSSQLLFTVI